MLYYSKNKEHRENSVTKYVYRLLYWASGVALDQAATPLQERCPKAFGAVYKHYRPACAKVAVLRFYGTRFFFEG